MTDLWLTCFSFREAMMLGFTDAVEVNVWSVSVCFVLQARIKKIMQTDEEIGKVAAAVPVIICILSLSSHDCVL